VDFLSLSTIEFKVFTNDNHADQLAKEVLTQIEEKGYPGPYFSKI
jgi:hypothetical protein